MPWGPSAIFAAGIPSLSIAIVRILSEPDSKRAFSSKVISLISSIIVLFFSIFRINSFPYDLRMFFLVHVDVKLMIDKQKPS